MFGFGGRRRQGILGLLLAGAGSTDRKDRKGQDERKRRRKREHGSPGLDLWSIFKHSDDRKVMKKNERDETMSGGRDAPCRNF